MFKDYDASVHLNTEHLLLRPLRYSDSTAIFHNIANDRDVLKYYIMAYADSPADFDFERIVDHFINSKRYAFAIVLKESDSVIGMIHQCNSADSVFQTTEIGYAIGRQYWNHGFMTEALDAVISFLFSIGIHKVICTHIVENAASGRVMQKCGMLPENGVRPEEVYYNGRYYDLQAYYKINKA